MFSWSYFHSNWIQQLNNIIPSCVALGSVFNLFKLQFILKTRDDIIVLRNSHLQSFTQCPTHCKSSMRVTCCYGGRFPSQGF